MTPNQQTRIIDAKLLSVLLGISTRQAAVMLAQACERKEIAGQEYLGGIKYVVSQTWLEEKKRWTN